MTLCVTRVVPSDLTMLSVEPGVVSKSRFVLSLMVMLPVLSMAKTVLVLPVVMAKLTGGSPVVATVPTLRLLVAVSSTLKVSEAVMAVAIPLILMVTLSVTGVVPLEV